MYIFMWRVHKNIQICEHMCALVYGLDLRWVLQFFPILFLRQRLSLTMELINLARQASQWASGICPCLFSQKWSYSLKPPCMTSMQMLGIWTQDLLLVQQVFLWLNYLVSPYEPSFGKRMDMFNVTDRILAENLYVETESSSVTRIICGILQRAG